jgi:hypothetical protein
MDVELTRKRESQQAFVFGRIFVPRRFLGCGAAGAGLFMVIAVFNAFIGDGGFTDDCTETADAGRSPHPQLRSIDSGV